MDSARDELLADAAFSANENGDVTVRHLFNDGGDPAHLLAVAPHSAVFVVNELLAQLTQLGDKPIFLDRVLDRDVERDFAEPFRIVGFYDVIGRAQTNGFDDGRRLV